MAGRRVLQFGKTGPWVSPIHVHDCARALVHLAEHGEVGRPLFPREQRSDPDARVRGNVRPSREPSIARVAHARGRDPTRGRSGPGRRYIQADAVFSNIRLRGIGFRFRYPTLEQGLQQVLGALHE